jgi:hypothetical protein
MGGLMDRACTHSMQGIRLSAVIFSHDKTVPRATVSLRTKPVVNKESLVIACFKGFTADWSQGNLGRDTTLPTTNVWA